MQAAGLEVVGACIHLSKWPGLREHGLLFQEFTAEEVDVLGSLMLHVRARPGQMLIVEGDINEWMMLLLEGTVDVGKRMGPEAEPEVRGDNTRLAVLRPGTMLGEMSMFDGEPRYASCWALGEVEAAVMDRRAVGQLVKSRPDIGAKLLVKLTQLLAQRLRNTSNQLVRLLRRQVAT
jgi:CRP-like cAMP-binding protein